MPFAELTASALYARFAGLENRLLSGGVISATDWRSTGDELEGSYERSLTATDQTLTGRAAPSATASSSGPESPAPSGSSRSSCR